ncbi:hypothetical protein ACFLX5_05005 [Chloroflexota bacterium]
MQEYPTDVYKNWMETLAKWVTMMFRVGKEVAGETYVQNLEKEFHKYGVKVGPSYAAQMGETGTDCISIGRILDKSDESLGCYWEGHIENSATAYEKRVISCPVAQTLSREPEICLRLLNSSAQGIINSINPNARYYPMDECIANGDNSCHARVELSLKSGKVDS